MNDLFLLVMISIVMWFMLFMYWLVYQLHHLNIVMRAIKGIVYDDKLSDEDKIRTLRGLRR